MNCQINVEKFVCIIKISSFKISIVNFNENLIISSDILNEIFHPDHISIINNRYVFNAKFVTINNLIQFIKLFIPSLDTITSYPLNSNNLDNKHLTFIITTFDNVVIYIDTPYYSKLDYTVEDLKTLIINEYYIFLQYKSLLHDPKIKLNSTLIEFNSSF